jgi:uncharacterized protein YaeQ
VHGKLELALKATIYKAHLRIADMDRNVYVDHPLTLALHPSENVTRLLVRVLAFAFTVPEDNLRGTLEFAQGLTESDEPDLWQRDLTGQIVHWVEVGQPDLRALSKACGRSERVTLFTHGPSWTTWWDGIEDKLSRLTNLAVWYLPSEQVAAIEEITERSVQWQVNIQDGVISIHDGKRSAEVTPERLKSASLPRN